MVKLSVMLHSCSIEYSSKDFVELGRGNETHGQIFGRKIDNLFFENSEELTARIVEYTVRCWLADKLVRW